MKPLEKGSLAPEQPPQNLDATHNIASLDELRRRAAEGDQVAVVELGRRQAEEAGRRSNEEERETGMRGRVEITGTLERAA